MSIKVSESITQPAGAVKPRRAAIWARVSTTGQRETSLPSQLERVSATLKQGGFLVPEEYIFSVSWSSLDLERCPDFIRLIGLIRRGEIQAIGVFDRDRLAAEPTQRLVFLSEAKEAGVEIIVAQGPPFIEGDEGALVEMALTIGKKRAVLRARQGSADGLHDRVASRGQPATWGRPPYGYSWERKADKTEIQPDLRLIPTADWPSVQLICNMLLGGSSYTPILKELERRGIPSPSGAPLWNKAALSEIVHNPIYAGRYFGLRRKAVEPQGEKHSARVNSSNIRLPLNKAVYMPNITIVDPPLTWDQRECILEQLARHQKLSQRRARADYLLRGMVFCGTHTGKRGQPRAYHGQPHYKSYRYMCPVGGCAHPFMKGPYIESDIKAYLIWLLVAKGEVFLANIQSPATQERTKDKLEKDLKAFGRKRKENLSAETKVVNEYAHGKIGEEVYTRLISQYQTEREWLEAEQDRALALLAQIGHEERAAQSLKELLGSFVDKMDSLTNADWRRLFIILNFKVIVKTREQYEAGLKARPKTLAEQVQQRMFDREWYWLSYDIPVTAEEEDKVRGIVSNAPWLG
jgi:site-specific DNA recombinase